jgi:hypothetical protein
VVSFGVSSTDLSLHPEEKITIEYKKTENTNNANLLTTIAIIIKVGRKFQKLA